MMNGGGMGGMGLMWVFGPLVLAGVIVLVVVLVKTLSGRSSNTGAPDHGRAPGADPGRGREILQERYARGELSAEEYRERLQTLEDDGR
ncbi:SHOCT domain-containing protein [Brevibacterium sp. SIMBA_078]|uniref:SHOCT domain-containing protein n=1 Tax=Brevibacterium sp. SIMBA_078 TaxID=3085816 RepID=UPI00397C969D